MHQPRHCLTLLLVAPLAALPQLSAQELGPKLTGWTYRTSSRPLADRYADPGGRLADGQTGRGKTAIWRGGTVTIDLGLGGPCRVATVRVFQHRHNLNYKLNHLAVSAKCAGMWEERARQRGFFGPTPTMDFVHTLDLGSVETAALRFDFVGANVLSVSEIEVFGSPVSAETGKLGVFGAIPFSADAGPKAAEKDLDGDGQVEVVLENAHVRLIFTPATGGICRSLRLKPTGEELVYSQRSGYGLLRDQLWKPKYSFADRVYFHRVENTKDRASVELWTTGVGGMMSFTEIRKRITLERVGPAVRVHYTLANQPSSQTDYEYGFWSHNWLGVLGAANTYFCPTTEGVRSFTLDPSNPSKKGGEAWYRNPARGWTAVVSDQGTGLAIEVPYRYLNMFYHWHGAGSLAATHEWRFNLVEVKAGDRLEADFTLIPFRGLRSVDGVVGDVIGQIDARVDGDSIAATTRLLTPLGVMGGAARLRLLGPDGNERELGAVDLRPGATVEIQGRVGSLRPGGYVARVDIMRQSKLVGSFEQPTKVGDLRVAYRLEPECERVGRTDELAAAKPGHEISTEVVTPHIPWARPFAGGKIRALVLMDDMNCREAVELAQRIDLELDYVKFRTTLAKELLYQGDLSILTLDAAQRALLERLRTRQYDVIIAAGFKWDFHFTPEIRESVLAHVRNGTGLILIQPDGFDEEAAEVLPVAGVAKQGNAARSMWGWHRWAAASDHPLVTGLDWSRFPITRRHDYDVPPQGEVVATIGKDAAPLLTLGSLGKGRVVSATWDTLTHAMSYRGYSALTPILSYRGGWLRPEFRSLPKRHQEWWFALLTRLTAWAAQRDTGVSIATAPSLEAELVDLGQLVLDVTVQSGRAASNAQIDTHWFTALGDELDVLKTQIDLSRGETVVPLRVPAEALTGVNTACFVVRDSAGAALAWGFTTVKLASPTRIAALDLKPDAVLPQGATWQEDRPVETRAFVPSLALNIAIRLNEPAPRPLAVDLQAYDSLGRQLLRSRTQIAAGAAEATVVVAPSLLVDQGLEIVATLRDEKRLFDRRRARAVAYRPRVWDRFWYTSWGGQYLWRCKYLFDFNNRLVRDFGVDVSFWGTTELGTGKVRDNAFFDINHSWLGLLAYFGRGVPNFMTRDFSKQAAQYAKTRDKESLVRKPSLADPEWREAVRKSLVERTEQTIARGGTYDYCMGDEMSLTHYTRFHDYDWSEHSLADFRRWLKVKYRDLAALNSTWDTAHDQWDEVTPLTREEARQASSPAPWFDFRTYMNDQLAGFYSFVQDTIRSVDPHARCGLSGTQSPEAGNGMDWWKLSKAFSYYHSYNTGWSNEMRRSFQRYGGADQSPYFSGYSVVNPGAENRLWWCLFHDTRGISAWKTGLFFYGDFTETQSGRDTKAHLRTFRRGIWRLLRGAKRQHDRIAIYYSMPTIIAGALTGEERKINAARDAWVKLVEDSGLQYEFVAYEQIAEGLLDNGEFRAVILPYTLALSKAEAGALRRFVRAGGTLIATRPVGVRDDLGRPQNPGLLDDVFGVSVEGTPEAAEPRIRLTEPIGGLARDTEVRLPVAMSNLVLTDARAHATASDRKAPALTVSANGRAALLNLDLTHFEQERRFHSPTERQLKAIVLDLLARGGVKSKYPLTLASGKPPQVEMVRYAAEGFEFLCLLNATNESDIATVRLGTKQHVYDVRSESYRGEMEILKVPLDPMCARVYCLAPRPLPAPTIVAPKTAARQVGRIGGEIKFTVGRTGPAPARQLIRVTVTDSKGHERDELMQTIWVGGKSIASSLPLAINDSTGAWTLTATDVISGQQAAARVQVESL